MNGKGCPASTANGVRIGIDLAAIIFFEFGALQFVQFRIVQDTHAVLGQRRQNIVEQAVALHVDHGAHGLGDQFQLVLGRPTGQVEVGDADRLLAFETADTLAEEFVQIAGRDGQKFEPFHQR